MQQNLFYLNILHHHAARSVFIYILRHKKSIIERKFAGETGSSFWSLNFPDTIMHILGHQIEQKQDKSNL